MDKCTNRQVEDVMSVWPGKHVTFVQFIIAQTSRIVVLY